MGYLWLLGQLSCNAPLWGLFFCHLYRGLHASPQAQEITWFDYIHMSILMSIAPGADYCWKRNLTRPPMPSYLAFEKLGLNIFLELFGYMIWYDMIWYDIYILYSYILDTDEIGVVGGSSFLISHLMSKVLFLPFEGAKLLSHVVLVVIWRIPASSFYIPTVYGFLMLQATVWTHEIGLRADLGYVHITHVLGL